MTSLNNIYNVYWKMTSIIWGFIFLDFNGVILQDLGNAAGAAFGLLMLIVLSMMALATVIFTKDINISSDLIVFGLFVPLGYIFWQYNWLMTEMNTLIVLGLVGYYFIMNITTLVTVIVHRYVYKDKK